MLEDAMQRKLITPKNGEHFIFPIADGTGKLSVREHGIRKSVLMGDQLVRSEDLSGDQEIRKVSTTRRDKT